MVSIRTIALLFLICFFHKSHTAATQSHHHAQKHKERLQDGMTHASFNKHSHEHDTEFDHEAILGSVKEAEEFHDLSPEESKKRLSILVTKMDLNKDKFIDRHELKAWILRSFKSLGAEEAQDRFEDCDENGDHKVTWAEYIKDTYGMESEEEGLEKNEVEDDSQDKMMNDDRELFKAADKDGDGVLILDEFIIFNNPEEYPEMLPIVLRQTLADKDVNGDDKIDFQEFVGESARDKDKEYLITEKDKFDNDFDKNKDGFLTGNEILSWMLPSSDEIATEEVDHLFVGSDDDHDERLSYDEIINNYDLFVGSEATEYGEHLQNIERFKDEL
uniref:Reticulocalbin-3 n=1 Tax=Culicoides sonorensis TaxID=179676 RepID=A0A336K9U9_CULSO